MQSTLNVLISRTQCNEAPFCTYFMTRFNEFIGMFETTGGEMQWKHEEEIKTTHLKVISMLYDYGLIEEFLFDKEGAHASGSHQGGKGAELGVSKSLLGALVEGRTVDGRKKEPLVQLQNAK